MTTASRAESLCAQMVGGLRRDGYLVSAEVQAAFEATPRHRFLPGVAMAAAYANDAVPIKYDAEGEPTSSASQPSIVARMLEQLDLRPGHRVLEVGAGTGYNAALLQRLVGPRGEVTTVDIDPELTDRARVALTAVGCGDVHVVTGDGSLGYADNAPYDRIIVTAGAGDLPPAWWEQLNEGGCLVVPLRWRGQTRSIAFSHHGSYMTSRSAALCGFIPLRGSDDERALPLVDGAVVIFHDDDQVIDPAILAGVLDRPRQETWFGVTDDGADGSLEGLWLRLTTVETGTCRIVAAPSAVDSGLATPAVSYRTAAVVDGASLAYLTVRSCRDSGGAATPRRELGAVSHGGGELIDRLAGHVRAWDIDRSAVPVITACPADSSDIHRPGGSVIRKRHIRMTFSWR